MSRARPLDAIVALPSANDYVEARCRLALSGWQRFAIVIGLMVGAGSLVGASHQSGPSPEAQTAAMPSAWAAAPSTLLDVDGNGSRTTRKFTSQADWDLRYSYDCSSFGEGGNFQVFIYNGTGSPSFENSGVNQLGANGSEAIIITQARPFILS